MTSVHNGDNPRVSKIVRDMDSVQIDISAWAEDTFPGHTIEGITAHLLSEAAEAYRRAGGSLVDAYAVVREAFVKEADPEGSVIEELADCAILAMTGAGWLQKSLHGHVEAKMYRNRKRKWGAPNEQGFTQHTEEWPPASVASSVTLDLGYERPTKGRKKAPKYVVTLIEDVEECTHPHMKREWSQTSDTLYDVCPDCNLKRLADIDQ